MGAVRLVVEQFGKPRLVQHAEIFEAVQLLLVELVIRMLPVEQTGHAAVVHFLAEDHDLICHDACLPSEAVPLDDDAVPRRQVDLDEQKLPVENGGKFQSGLNLLNIWRDL